MKVLLAGASGVLGQPTTAALNRQGHEVVGLVRREESAARLAREGVPAIAVDALDRVAVHAAVGEVRPDVIINQLTALTVVAGETFADALGRTASLRTIGTANLMRAAAEVGVRRMVSQSIAFAYAPVGGSVLEEYAPLYLDAPGPWGSTVHAVATLENLTLGTPRVSGAVLRYGFLYGPGTAFGVGGSTYESVVIGELPVVDDGAGLWSFLHLDDAAEAAVVAAAEGPPGIYNIVDDNPARQSDWLPEYAMALHAPKPDQIDSVAAESRLGWLYRCRASSGRGACNERARQHLGWTPQYPDWRQSMLQAERRT